MAENCEIINVLYITILSCTNIVENEILKFGASYENWNN